MEEENEVDGLLLFDVSGEQAVFPVQKGEFPIFPCDVAQCRTAMDNARLMKGAQRAAGLFEKLFLVFFRHVGIEPVLQRAPAVPCHHIVRRQHQDLRAKLRRGAEGDGHLRHFEIKFLLAGVLDELLSAIAHLPLDPVRLAIQREGNHSPVHCLCYRFLRRLFQPRIIFYLTHTLPRLNHFYLYFTKGKAERARFGRGD